jgi:Ca2+-binding EF-hand superfamily protein
MAAAATLDRPAIEAAFDGFDVRRIGTIPLTDADLVLRALAPDATRQQVTTALQENSEAAEFGTKVIRKAKFVGVVESLAPARFSADDSFRGFASLDPGQTSRVSAQSLRQAAVPPLFLACDQKAAADAVTSWGAYPAKGLSLPEWQELLSSIAPKQPRKGTKY